MKKKRYNFSVLNAKITSAVSVSLVLLILGIVAVIGTATRNITDDIKENLGFDIVLREDVDQQTAMALCRQLNEESFTSTVELYTPEQAMQKWQEATGENVVEIIGVNPFANEINVHVTADAATPDSIQVLAEIYRGLEFVDEVTVHADMIDSINNNTHTLMLVMGIVAFALLLISFVLINNTVRLTVYSRRFIIHTMKLVGATNGFIRKPFIKSNVINGLIAGLIADIIIVFLINYANKIDSVVNSVVDTTSRTILYISLPLVGMAICALAATFATNRYLKMNHDDLFS